MYTMIKQYTDKIKGTFAFFDRMIINGYFRPFLSEQMRSASLVCSGKTVAGKRITGFNVWSPDVVRIMETVCGGRYLISGFRNKDIGKIILPEMKDHRKRSSKTSHILKKLRKKARPDQKSPAIKTVSCHIKGAQDHGRAHRTSP